ncbi:MAG: hypothetical protein HY575_06110 [candidate division NC10 bacterium]|nr:hypothetical protein [candidate division NC10 bacterium]
MKRQLFAWWLILLLALLVAPLLAACGGGKGKSPAAAAAAEREWVLIRNPRFGATMAEPEYIWVDRQEIPKSLTGYVFGAKHVFAPPDVYAKAGPPPGPGKIWRPVEGETPSAAAAGPAPGAAPPASPPGEARAPAALGALRPEDRRGYVVLVDGMRVVIDLADGEVKKDALIAITRRQALTHPVTREHLGEIILEVGRARIMDVQPKFSVAELIGFKPGLTVRPQDRVTVLPGTP